MIRRSVATTLTPPPAPARRPSSSSFATTSCARLLGVVLLGVDTSSGFAGSSYGSSTPVKPLISPRERLLVEALDVAARALVDRGLDVAPRRTARTPRPSRAPSARVSSYGEIAAAITAPPWRVSREATQPMRSMFVSRSSFEKPRPFERCVRTVSPSRYSTTQAAPVELGPDEVRDRRLAGAGEPGEPEREAAAAACVRLGMLVRVDVLGSCVSFHSGASSIDGCRTRACRSPPSARRAPPRRARRPRAGDAADRAVARRRAAGCRESRSRRCTPRRASRPSRRAGAPSRRRSAPTTRPSACRARLGDWSRRMPGDPGVVRLERRDQRLDLADVAAAVGVALPEVRALALVLLGDGDHLGPDQR